MRLVGGLTFLVLGFFVTSDPPLANGHDPGARGPYAVGHTSFLLVDSSRNSDSTFGGRPVFVSLWYPVDPDAVGGAPRAVYALDPIYGVWPATHSGEWEALGIDAAYESVQPAADSPFPLVMFSMGWGGRYTGAMFVATRVASHGFVVAVVQHFRDGNLAWDPRDHLAIASMNRPADVSFSLTALLARNDTPGDPLYRLVRPDKIVASGHSLGGYAAMTLAAGDDVVCDTVANPPPETCVASTPDPRISAIVPLDGSNQLLHFSELARVTVPSLSLGQEWENVEDWQARQHAAFRGQPNYRVDVNRALHGSFTNSCTVVRMLLSKGLISQAQANNTLNSPLCTTAISQLESVRLVSKYMVAFLKTQVSGEEGYQPILTPGWAITAERDIEFFVTERTSAPAIDEDWPCCYMYFPNQPGSTRARGERDPLFVRAVEHLADWR